MIIAEILIALAALPILYLGWFKIGNRVVRNPMAFVIALLLVLQAIAPRFIWFAVRTNNARNEFRKLQADVQAATQNREIGGEGIEVLNEDQLNERYWYIDPVISGAFLLGAAVLTIISLASRDPLVELAVASQHLSNIAINPMASGVYPSLTGAGRPSGLLRTELLPLIDKPVNIPPDLPPEVNTYQGTKDSVPPEVFELGDATMLHGPVKRSFLGRMFQGPPPPTYIIFKQALVIVIGDDFTVIPWSAIAELNSNYTLKTLDGQTFRLATEVEHFPKLFARLQKRIRERWLPPLAAEVDAGGFITFGEFSLSRTEVAHEGRTLPWEAIGSVQIWSDPAGRQRRLIIREIDSRSSWCQVDLNRTPNDWLLIEVLQRLCPPHLLQGGSKA
jgi:hypothetical protein